MKSLKLHRAGKLLIAIAGFILCYSVAQFSGFIAHEISHDDMTVYRTITEESGDHAPLRVAIYPCMGFVPGLIENNGLAPSQKSDYYKNHNVLVSFTIAEDWPSAVRDFKAGRIDVLWCTADMAASHWQELKKFHPAAFMVHSLSSGAHTIASDSSLRTPLDFTDKTVACVKKSPAHFMMLQVLSQCGIDKSRVRWKYTPTDRNAAMLFSKKKADIYAGMSDDLERVSKKRKDASVLISTSDTPGLIAGIFIARESLLVSREELLTGFTAGWLEGMERSVKNPAQSIEAAVKIFKFSPEEAQRDRANWAVCDYYKNLEFFGLGKNSATSFTDIFYISSSHWNENTRWPSRGRATIAKNTAIINRLSNYKKTRFPFISRQRQPVLLPPWRGVPVQISQTHTLFFNENAMLDYSSRSTLDTVNAAAAIFPGSFIVLRDRGISAENGAVATRSRYIDELSRILIYKLGIAPARISYSGNIRRHDVTGDNRAGHVDIALTLTREK